MHTSRLIPPAHFTRSKTPVNPISYPHLVRWLLSDRPARSLHAHLPVLRTVQPYPLLHSYPFRDTATVGVHPCPPLSVPKHPVPPPLLSNSPYTASGINSALCVHILGGVEAEGAATDERRDEDHEFVWTGYCWTVEYVQAVDADALMKEKEHILREESIGKEGSVRSAGTARFFTPPADSDGKERRKGDPCLALDQWLDMFSHLSCPITTDLFSLTEPVPGALNMLGCSMLILSSTVAILLDPSCLAFHSVLQP